VIVHDISAPVPDVATLPTETFSCETTPTAPTASDNCAGTVVGVSDLVLPITSFGPTTITWTFTDDCGNVTTQTQNVIIDEMDVSTFVLNDGITIVANNTGGTYQWIDCTTNQPIVGETGPSYTATYNGDFAVEITKGNCFDVSACTTISTVGISEIGNTELVKVYPNPTSGAVKIESENTVFDQVIVRNAIGQEVERLSITSVNQYVLNLPEEPGVYFVEIFNQQVQKTMVRIIKQ